ncbi:polysaccharide biosynthesis/export family protein [Mucilaginibacter sp. Mucisp84]|uniref:polysaccharide biosynthesis/export family protein n=1 Tax=Mucilaginibacter sp. Mucisp84 TaxID=3243058 RepID=UPI0039A4581C
MRRKHLLNLFIISLILFGTSSIFSCSSQKKIKYFQDIPDSGQLKTIPAAAYTEPKVQVDDILSVVVQTIDPLSTQIINTGNINPSSSTTPNQPLSSITAASAGAGQQSGIAGYLVDKEGNIDIPILGKIQVVGHTTSELKTIIHDVASKYYNNPTVIVRYANFKISVTGEVLKPGVYILPNEKVSLLDAIAMAGDLTIFGKRDNILLIRENLDGTKTPYRVNLKKSDIMSSPYFYLRQNDVIYVQPDVAKSAATDAAQARNYTIIGSLLSVLVIYLTRK